MIDHAPIDFKKREKRSFLHQDLLALLLRGSVLSTLPAIVLEVGVLASETRVTIPCLVVVRRSSQALEQPKWTAATLSSWKLARETDNPFLRFV